MGAVLRLASAGRGPCLVSDRGLQAQPPALQPTAEWVGKVHSPGQGPLEKATFVMQTRESGRPSSFQTEALFPGTGTPVPTGRAMPSSWGHGNTCRRQGLSRGQEAEACFRGFTANTQWHVLVTPCLHPSGNVPPSPIGTETALRGHRSRRELKDPRMG